MTVDKNFPGVGCGINRFHLSDFVFMLKSHCGAALKVRGNKSSKVLVRFLKAKSKSKEFKAYYKHNKICQWSYYPICLLNHRSSLPVLCDIIWNNEKPLHTEHFTQYYSTFVFTEQFQFSLGSAIW